MQINATHPDAPQILALAAELVTEVVRLRQAVELLTARGEEQHQARPASNPTRAPASAEQLVTLDQIAAICHLAKSSMERYRKRMPAPAILGRGGRASRWKWDAALREFLVREFAVPNLPDTFPGAC